jgi:cytidylate kinase
MFRVLTVAREYGSGGASMARKISESLGWELLDKALILEVARSMHAEAELIGQYDERVDSWVHRVSRRGLWHGAFEEVAAVAEGAILDAETVAERARTIIEAAYKKGNCVIVGRGGQCVLQDRADAFHVFIYAPWSGRVARIRQREPRAADVDELITATDRQRAEYIQLHFGSDWANPHLYHMMLSSGAGEEGEDKAVSILLDVLKRG